MNLLVLLSAPVVLVLSILGWWLPGRGKQVCAVLAAATLTSAVLVVLVASPDPGVDGVGRGLLAIVAVAAEAR